MREKDLDVVIGLIKIILLRQKFGTGQLQTKRHFLETRQGISNGLQKGFNGLKGKHLQLLALNEAANSLAQSFGGAVDKGANFQQSMADLQAITGIAGADLESLGAFARKSGMDTGLGASQSVNALKTLASQIEVSKMGMSGLMSLQKNRRSSRKPHR